MKKIAVIFPHKVKGTDDLALIREWDTDFNCDLFYYSDKETAAPSKINKKDCVLDLDLIKSGYKVIIMVDAEVTKYVSGLMGGPQKFNAYAHTVDGVTYISSVNPRRTKVLPLLKKKVDAVFNTANMVLDAIKNGEPIKETFEKDYKILESTEELMEALRKCGENKCLVTDCETSALYPDKGYLLGIGVGWRHHMGYYAPMELWDGKAITLFSHLIRDPEVMTVCHNISFEMKWFSYHLNIDPLSWRNYHDTMFLHYIFDENSPADLKTLSVKYTDLGNYEDELEQEKKKIARQLKIKLADFSYAMIPLEILGPYACKDIDATAQILKKFFKYGKKFSIIYNRLLYCAPGIAILEQVGGPVYAPAVEDAIANYDDIIADLEDELYSAPEVQALTSLQGKPFNPRSHPQVRRLLYEVADLPVIKTVDPKDKNSNPSTDASVLEAFEEQFPIAKKLLDYRRATKFRGTYLVNILEKLSKDSRLRTGFNMARTTSGRLSSSGNINYQNIPRGPKIKSLFRARPGYKILQMDLGTAEVWVAAAESDDQFFKEAFDSGLDFHGYIAKTAFKLPCEPNEVAELFKPKRQAAKAITFGILYGAQAKKIASEIGCSVEEAQKLINDYFKAASGLKRWIDACKWQIESKGWIKSKFGRTRRVPEVYSTSKGVKYHAINSAFNFVVQSSASDMNLLAFAEMIRHPKIIEWLANDLALPWNLVHDSILFEVKEELVDDVIEIMATTFQQICKTEYPNMKTPIKLDFELGDSWGEVKKYKEIREWKLAA